MKPSNEPCLDISASLGFYLVRCSEFAPVVLDDFFGWPGPNRPVRPHMITSPRSFFYPSSFPVLFGGAWPWSTLGRVKKPGGWAGSRIRPSARQLFPATQPEREGLRLYYLINISFSPSLRLMETPASGSCDPFHSGSEFTLLLSLSNTVTPYCSMVAFSMHRLSSVLACRYVCEFAPL